MKSRDPLLSPWHQSHGRIQRASSRSSGTVGYKRRPIPQVLWRSTQRSARSFGDAMIDPMGIRQAILELGLEDLIPLPEMVTSQEIRSACGEDISIGPLRTALICLLREDRIQIWSGHWSQDPQVVDSAVAESLLLIDEQYIFNSSSDRRIRVYYANVDNIRA